MCRCPVQGTTRSPKKGSVLPPQPVCTESTPGSGDSAGPRSQPPNVAFSETTTVPPPSPSLAWSPVVNAQLHELPESTDASTTISVARAAVRIGVFIEPQS